MPLLTWKGNNLFNNAPNFLGQILALVLFVTSALVSGLLVLGYPFYLFWHKKQIQKALKLVGYTTIWLIGFILLTILLLIIF